MTLTARPVRGVALMALLLWLSASCGGHRPPPATAKSATLDSAWAISLLSALADDSMQGRGTATPGGDRAARFIADRMREYGLVPAGDSGYFQRVPLSATTDSAGGRHLDLATGGEPGEATVRAVNVVGMVRGSDSALRDQVILIDAHYDHLGIGPAVNGDSIYNGADDDGSGVVAVLGAARALAAGPPPRRTVLFLATTGEELGLLGTRWYLDHPVVPLERTVANLEIEMIGRPDSLAGGPGKGWLTGFERSTMGPMLAKAGIPIVADPHPAQQFYLRSDNIAFARRGIPAHTLSSYGMHRDYHTPADELAKIDGNHLATMVQAAARAARLLADGNATAWNPGGRP
jgi:Zn-dependent M28 family amino/carboxypeptidase